MNQESIAAIKQSKAVWLDQFARIEVIFVLCALVVLLTIMALDAWKSRTAPTRLSAMWWSVGALLTGTGALASVLLLYALVSHATELLRPVLLLCGVLVIAVMILWTRSGIQIETGVTELRKQLADANRAMTEHQTQLDSIVSRRTRVLNEEIVERRKAQQQLTQALEQNAAELEFASGLQQALLDPPPALDFAEIRVNYQAASEVSGDTYSLVHNDAAIRVVLADAMGHGVSAALLTQLVLAASLGAPMDGSPGELFQRLNHMISNARQQAYVTASWLKLEADGRLQFCGAGNAPLLIFRFAAQQMELLDGAGQPLGMFEEILSAHQVQSAQLQPGDRVLALTDGLLEWADADGAMFGIAGVEQALRDCASDPLDYAIAGLQNAAWEHAGMRRCRDDITVIGIEYRGAATV